MLSPAKLPDALAAVADDHHGGRLLQQWFVRFATTPHSERLGPQQLLAEFAATQPGPPETWDLAGLPFIVTAVHSRLDLATPERCGELRVSLASTHPIYRPFHLIFLFAQPPVPGDISPGGALHCTATALRLARLGQLADAEFFAAALALRDERVRPENFLAAESVEFTISPWEWRQWFLGASVDDPMLPRSFDDRPLFQTVDTPRLNQPGPDRDNFLAWVSANADAIDQRRILIPDTFRPLSARLNQGVAWVPLQLPPDLEQARPTLRKNLEIVGCPATPRPTLAQIAARIHPDDRARVSELVRQALRTGDNFDHEHRLVMDDGAVKLVRVVGRTRVATSGAAELVGAATDITASRRAADELQQAQAKLTHIARVTTLGELAASIAHEINQPLAAIIADASAALNWLAADPPRVERVRESLLAIIGDGERASEVLLRIRALLARSAVRHRPCDLNAIVRDIVPLVAPGLARHDVAVDLDLAGELPPVPGDPVQLQQVVLNLLLNAGEAARELPPERRRVQLRSFVETRSATSFVHVAIADHGPGVAERDADHIFDAFYTTKENGLGMGLSISRSIIDRHGGRLWARPNQPFGAIFQFALEVPA